MKHELHERGALDALGLDVLDAGDVQEVVLIVVGEKPFHLLGIHPAVRLRDEHGRRSELGKDIDGHALDHHDGGERDGHDRDQQGDWATQREANQTHGISGLRERSA
jgi:hypothetical protein